MVKVPKGYRSKDVQDRRGGGGGGGFGGGGLGFPGRRRGGGSGGGINLPGGGDLGGTMGGGRTGGSRMPSRRAGCGGGGMVVMLIVVALLFVMCSGGTNFGSDVLSDGPAPQRTPAPDAPAVTEAEDLVNFVLDDVQQFWTEVYADAGETYPRAQLVLFDNSVDTGGCGRATSQVGPFYCPADSNAYIDLQFMLLLQSRLGAEGDFAQAYILAHEIGHHVQNVEGINKAVREAQANRSRADANRLSVAMELQADCLAGMWARSAQQAGLLEQGDIEEGVRAADAVGDDAITGSSNQENFTHGTSAERVRWFRIGMETGDFNECTRTFEGL